MKSFSDSADKAFAPAGFSEIKKMFDSTKESTMSYADMKTYMSDNYMFEEGQITSAITRACDKGLLKRTKRGVYAYNDRYPNVLMDGDADNTGTISLPLEDKVKQIFENALSAAGRINVADISTNDVFAYQAILGDISRFADKGKFDTDIDIDLDLYSRLPDALQKRLSDCILMAESKTRSAITLFELPDAHFLNIYSCLLPIIYV